MVELCGFERALANNLHAYDVGSNWRDWLRNRVWACHVTEKPRCRRPAAVWYGMRLSPSG